MAKRIAVSTLNASTIDILNVIRQNAGTEYMSQVPKVEKTTDIPHVGEIIYGTPALSNRFLSELVNRIAMVVVKSATFNNPYSRLKKGYLGFGETIEEVFVSLAKAMTSDPEKAPRRELASYIPDVRTAFHVINWRAMYPVTIRENDLQQAFINIEGVQSLIAKIVDSVYKGAEYDEFLLFKYMIIKSLSHGKIKVRSVDVNDIKNGAVAFRATSNLLTFMSSSYNAAGVRNNTPRDKQIIFMDAAYNAYYDVEVLAAAFNMDKATYTGALYLIDDFTSFDMERFSVIRAESDGIEDITQEELALLSSIKAVIFDEDWFMVYDNLNRFTETFVSSAPQWNYFYHTWKTVSYSPFANAVAFSAQDAVVEPPASLTAEIVAKDISEEAIAIAVSAQVDGVSLSPQNVTFVQTPDMVETGIGITKYGAIYVPKTATGTGIKLTANVDGKVYAAGATISPSTVTVGSAVTMTPVEADATSEATENRKVKRG